MSKFGNDEKAAFHILGLSNWGLGKLRAYDLPFCLCAGATNKLCFFTAHYY
jgi:hypothetical protein